MRGAKSVVTEIRRRARAGMPLTSGENRGDWLYASAVKYLGSWGAAVEAAGFDYGEIKTRPLTADEVLKEIRTLADTGERLLAADHPRLATAARRHYDLWKAALTAAGRPDASLSWTRQRVIDGIHRRERRGLRVNSVAMMKQDQNLYVAGRRRFGSWAAALEAASGDEAVAVVASGVRRGRHARRR